MGRRLAAGVKEAESRPIGEDCQSGEGREELGTGEEVMEEVGTDREKGEEEKEEGNLEETETEHLEKVESQGFTDVTESKNSTEQCFICPRPASITCPGCTLMACCSAHLALHRPATACLPWSIARLPVVGRVLVAARDIAPYELILRDSPLVIVPKKGSTATAKDENREMCGEEEKEMCTMLASKGLLPLNGKLSVGQLLAYWRLKNLEEEKASLVLGLMDHRGEREKKEEFVEKEEELARFIQSTGESCSIEEAGRLLGVVDTNSLEIIGGRSGVFPALSLLSHSCTPTLEHWVDREVVVVRARHAIKKGEELTIRYSHLSMHRSLLRPLISEAWHFTCQCPRCQDGSELGTFASCPRCPTSGCPALLQPPVFASNLQNSNHPPTAKDLSPNQGNQSPENLILHSSQPSSTPTWNCSACSASATEEDVVAQANSLTMTLVVML